MIQKVISPFQKFVKTESLSGILLFLATIIALLWANSPFKDSYESLWQFKTGITSSEFELSKPLILWINDGLMAVFFFLIGLEIKRELLIGELNTIKKASFPLVAAIGGMLVPISIFLIFNKNAEAANGWGVPMATDIAFSLAVLNLLGKRVPLSLKIFLTAFAIVDDLGAVIVIAVFYSGSINWLLLFIALAAILVIYILSYYKIYSKYLLLFVGMAVWLLFLKSGIHPTIAGVLLAFGVPISRRIDINTYTNNLERIVKKIKDYGDGKKPVLCKQQIEHIDHLEDWTNLVQSPLQHLEHKLHNWVAYFIMPLFALANAGITISSDMAIDWNLAFVISISLIGGNFLGICITAFLGMKLKIFDLPAGTRFINIVGISLLAGVGFTMSIFVANLAFVDNIAILNSAKMGILIGSVIAGISSYLVLRKTLK